MNSKKFKFVVKELKDKSVVLELDNNQQITLSISDFSTQLKVDDVLFATFNEVGEEKTARDMAKAVINEMLNPES